MSTTTGLKLAADSTSDEYMMNIPLKISDAACMLKRVVGTNMKEYDREVITLNNRLVEEWYDKVLKNIASTDGTIPAARAHPCFMTFYDGKEVESQQNFKTHIVDYQEERVKYWIRFLHTASIESLHEAGIGIVTSAWSIITSAIKSHFAQRKWEEVYSISNDPLEWDISANDLPALFNGRELPFDLSRGALQDMEEKVQAIVSKPIRPNPDTKITGTHIKVAKAVAMLKRPISKNEKPFDRKVLSLNDQVVDEYHDRLLKSLALSDGTVAVQDIYTSFMTFYEGKEIQRYRTHVSHLNIYREEQVKFWINFFDKSTISEIHRAGLSVVSAGWAIIIGAIRYWFADLKWQEMYSKSDDPLEWHRLVEKYNAVQRDLPMGLTRPFLAELEEKVKAVVSRPIEPKVGNGN